MARTIDSKRSGSHELSPITAEVEKNEVRSQQILECQRQIKFWNSKLKRLQNEQTRHFKIAELRTCAESSWEQLSDAEKDKKEILLAALESEKLPLELCELLPENMFVDEAIFADDGWDSDDDDDPTPEGWHIPQNLLLDRDVCLARVRRKETWDDHSVLRSVIPANLRGDKEIMLAAFKYGSIDIMSENLRADIDVFEAYLDSEETSGDCWKYFCEDFRSDEAMILKLCNHPGITVRFLKHCSRSLVNDKQFFLRAVEAIISSRRGQKTTNHSLDDFILYHAPEHLQDDFEVVMSCLRQSGLNLQFASYRLRQNAEIVAAACAQDADAVRFKRFKGDEKVYLRWSSSDMSFDWSAVPEHLQSSTDFVVTMLAFTNGQIWDWLPLEMKNKVQVASTFVCNSCTINRDARDAFRLCPQLRSDRMAMRKLIENSNYEVHFRWVLKMSEIDIRNDKELMTYAVKNNLSTSAWQHCAETLRFDTDIIAALAESDPFALTRVDEPFLLNHPELIVRTVEKKTGDWCEGEWKHFCNGLPEQMWLNRIVVLAFLHANQLIPDSSRAYFADDEELILSSLKSNTCHFDYLASDTLRMKKEFVLKAISKTVDVVQWVSIDMARDFEVALTAISSNARAIKFYLEMPKGLDFLVSFAQKVRTNLRNYAAFQNEIVEPMSLPPMAKKRRTLSMLNQGPLMLSSYADRVAEYLGVLRSQQDYELYLAASNHLAVWGL